MEEVLQQIDFPPFYIEREMRWNQSAGVGFFNINPLYWEKVEREKKKINLLELLLVLVKQYYIIQSQ